MIKSPATKVERIQTYRELWHKDPQPGYEWDAGTFHMTVTHPAGRITVKLTAGGWEVWRIYFPLNMPKLELMVDIYPLGEEGERSAKKCAREVFEKYRGG